VKSTNYVECIKHAKDNGISQNKTCSTSHNNYIVLGLNGTLLKMSLSASGWCTFSPRHRNVVFELLFTPSSSAM